jgi:tRNA threonylcarbamoyladenosine biosynthesis protein TsaE
MWRAKSLSMKGKLEGLVREIALPDEAATRTLGGRLARRLRPGDTLALEGDLGTGKTTLVRAVLRALDIQEDVPSPTFTLVQQYEAPGFSIDHFDLYRIEDPSEVDQLGLEDALAERVAFIEWPDRAGSRLPPDALHIHLEVTGPQSRRATLRGSAKWAARLFESTSNEC